MTTTGVAGGRWRATVTPWGAVEPWDGSNSIDWFIAADDRWHRPQHETSTRQTLVDGTPVVETRVRIPSGDAVHRVYSVADAGGLTIIEVTNESTLPIAIAVTGGGLLSRRPPTSMAPQGIDLPADAAVFPVGHRSTLVVGRAHGAAGTSHAVLPDGLPGRDQVSRGWLAQTHRASRLQLPDAALVDAVTAARCELLLNGPAAGVDELGFDGDLVDLEDLDGLDPSTFVLAIAELVRMGDRAAIWVPDVATQLERLARSGSQIDGGVIEAAARVLHAAGEHRAVDDLRRMKLPAHTTPVGAAADERLPTTPGLVPWWVERRLVVAGEHSARLMPGSFPQAWLGIDF
ncbi:MAG: hypothetical protein ABIZ69_14895, partial [Ilumatobacteraceae bacterium]